MYTGCVPDMGSQFGGCEYGHLVPGVGRWSLPYLDVYVSHPLLPQIYWTAGVVAQGTAGAQNCHNTAKIVSNFNKVLNVYSCFLV